jgi:hypothetical protein
MKPLLLLGAMMLAAAAARAAQSPTDAEPAVATSPAAAAPATTPAATTPPATRPRTAAPAPAPANSPGTQPSAGTRQPAQGTASGTDRVELGTTQITGNAELPRVMYVVPWKRTELGDLSGKPAKSLLDEVLAPVDRDVFQRQNRYYDALRPDAPAAAPQGEK